jgi:hypothetical protein
MSSYHSFSILLGMIGIILLVIGNRLPSLVQYAREKQQIAESKMKEEERIEKLEKYKSIKAAGDRGEKLVKYMLDRIDTEIYQAWNDIDLLHNGISQQIDHIVIGPCGLVHIETKYNPGELTFTQHGIEQVKKDNYGNRMEKILLKDPTGQIILHMNIIKKVLNENGLKDVKITNVVCVAHEKAVIMNSPVNSAFLVCRETGLLNLINELPATIDLDTQKKLSESIEAAIQKRVKETEKEND